MELLLEIPVTGIQPTCRPIGLSTASREGQCDPPPDDCANPDDCDCDCAPPH